MKFSIIVVKVFKLFLGLLISMLLLVSKVTAADIKYKRSIEKYKIADVYLVNQDGKKVSVRSMVEKKEPVVIDFIYATCTTICPVLSVGFSNLQNRLAATGKKVNLISITIDPENDTPKVMKDYLNRFRAKPGWDFLTGNRGDIEKVMRAFNAYIPDKMSHYPINIIRNPKDGNFVRLYGMMSSSEFMEEYQRVAGK